MEDRPGSVPRPLTPMKRPRSLQSGSSAESDTARSTHGAQDEAQTLRQQLEHAEVLATCMTLASASPHARDPLHELTPAPSVSAVSTFLMLVSDRSKHSVCPNKRLLVIKCHLASPLEPITLTCTQAAADTVTRRQADELEALRQELGTVRARLAAVEMARTHAEEAAAQASALQSATPALEVCRAAYRRVAILCAVVESG